MAAAGVDPDREAKARSCILLELNGGPSQIDTLDPKMNSGFRPISTTIPGIQISELLPRTARNMDKLAIIRSMHHDEVDHTQARHYTANGHRLSPAMEFASVGSIIAKELSSPNQVPPYVTIGSAFAERFFGAAALGTEYNPLRVPDPNQTDFRIPDLTLPGSLTPQRIEDRRSFLKVVDHLYRQKEGLAESNARDAFRDKALQMILSPAVKKAFDLSQESDKTKEAYGRHGIGQAALLARRLVETGCRFVTASGWGFADAGWDTHGIGSGGANDKKLRDTLCPVLDQTLATLVEDLDQRGLLESTIVIAMGEFGRTPHVNSLSGRDHWPFCFSVVMGGGGLAQGQVVGASDERGAYVAERGVSIGDLFATLYKALGIDWTKEYMTPVGRPIKIANSIDDMTGEPIGELF